MRLLGATEGSEVRFTIELDPEDKVNGIGQGGAQIELKARTFRFDLPVVPNRLHPDLLALACLTVVQPWVGKRVVFSAAISSKFASAVREKFGVDAGPVEPTLAARIPGARPALSFSGGVDSVAAYMVLPPSTVLVHLERVPHPEHPVHHPANPSIARDTVERFPNCQVVRTDIEHIVKGYPSLPTWCSVAAPALLLADHFGLHSVSFGTIMGSAYLPAGRHYRSLARIDESPWNTMFATVAVPVSRPVAGLSEFGTTMISRCVRQAAYITSCMLGTSAAEKACMRCKKCFRKSLVEWAFVGRIPENVVLQRFLEQQPIRDLLLSTPPIYFQHIFAGALARMNVEAYPLLAQFKTTILAEELPTSWLTKWYAPAESLIWPESEREGIIGTLLKFVDVMTDDERRSLETWDLDARYTIESQSAPGSAGTFEIVSARLPVRFLGYTQRALGCGIHELSLSFDVTSPTDHDYRLSLQGAPRPGMRHLLRPSRQQHGFESWAVDAPTTRHWKLGPREVRVRVEATAPEYRLKVLLSRRAQTGWDNALEVDLGWHAFDAAPEVQQSALGERA